MFADGSFNEVVDVDVQPGDALLLPAGRWHWARSLSISISVTFSSFVLDNTALRHM